MDRPEWNPARRASRRAGWLEDAGFGATLAGIAAAILLQMAAPAVTSYAAAAAAHRAQAPATAAESSPSQSRPTSA